MFTTKNERNLTISEAIITRDEKQMQNENNVQKSLCPKQDDALQTLEEC